MAKIVAKKQCERCNKTLYNVDTSTKYCNNCKIEVRKERYHRNKKPRLLRPEQDYINNFNNVVSEAHHLLPKGFNKISKLKSSSYLNFYRMSWIEILKKYNRYDELLSYIINEFKKYVEETGNENIRTFYGNHAYVSDNVLREIGYENIKKTLNLKTQNYTKQDLIDNFRNIEQIVGDIPIYPEFVKHTNITFNAYFNPVYFNIQDKRYQSIVRAVCNEEEFQRYKFRTRKHKSEVGKITGVHFTYTEKDLENEFRRVFEYCKQEYGQYPSSKLFEKLSSINLTTYKSRVNNSWYDIVEGYGYPVERTANFAEKITLDLIMKLTGVKYTPQKTFKWLRGVKDFPLFVDGYYKDLNLIVEFDGRQHREPVSDFGGKERFKMTVANDRLKDRLIKEHNIKLIRISSDDEWFNPDYISKILQYNNIPLKKSA